MMFSKAFPLASSSELSETACLDHLQRTWLEPLQQQLQAAAEPATKAKFEAYMKGAIAYRGLKSPQVDALFKAWYATSGVTQQPGPVQKAIALEWLDQVHREDKSIGMLLLAKLIRPQQLDWAVDLPLLAQRFESGAIREWSSCDELGMAVLNPLIRQQGEPCARAIAQWRDAAHPWQRRAACIPFVSLARHGDAIFPGLTELLLTLCTETLRSPHNRPERFVQTGVGWLLRELWRADPEAVVALIEMQIQNFSSEGLRYATEKMLKPEQQRLRTMRKQKLGTSKS